MIIGVYNIQPNEKGFMSDYLKNRQFIIDTDDYDNWRMTKYVEGGKGWKEVITNLIDFKLERRNYGHPGELTYEWAELKLGENGSYYFANQPLRDFGEAEKIEFVTYKEQMDLIWRDIMPVIGKMLEAYPTAKPEPEFQFKFNSGPADVSVKLKGLKFTIEN